MNDILWNKVAQFQGRADEAESEIKSLLLAWTHSGYDAKKISLDALKVKPGALWPEFINNWEKSKKDRSNISYITETLTRLRLFLRAKAELGADFFSLSASGATIDINKESQSLAIELYRSIGKKSDTGDILKKMRQFQGALMYVKSREDILEKLCVHYKLLRDPGKKAFSTAGKMIHNAACSAGIDEFKSFVLVSLSLAKALVVTGGKFRLEPFDNHSPAEIKDPDEEALSLHHTFKKVKASFNPNALKTFRAILNKQLTPYSAQNVMADILSRHKDHAPFFTSLNEYLYKIPLDMFKKLFNLTFILLMAGNSET